MNQQDKMGAAKLPPPVPLRAKGPAAKGKPFWTPSQAAKAKTLDGPAPAKAPWEEQAKLSFDLGYAHLLQKLGMPVKMPKSLNTEGALFQAFKGRQAKNMGAPMAKPVAGPVSGMRPEVEIAGAGLNAPGKGNKVFDPMKSTKYKLTRNKAQEVDAGKRVEQRAADRAKAKNPAGTTALAKREQPGMLAQTQAAGPIAQVQQAQQALALREPFKGMLNVTPLGKAEVISRSPSPKAVDVPNKSSRLPRDARPAPAVAPMPPKAAPKVETQAAPQEVAPEAVKQPGLLDKAKNEWSQMGNLGKGMLAGGAGLGLLGGGMGMGAAMSPDQVVYH
jgi:hypothetical protein